MDDSGSPPPRPPHPPPPAAPPGGGEPAPSLADGLRFAFGTLTVLPVGAARWDRATARLGMLCAPAAGLAVGTAAALLGGFPLLLGSGAPVAAVVSVAATALLTRALHLDGLADTADGLGSGRPAAEALDIMKRSDIGPFGVVTLVLVLLAQTAALTELYAQSWAQGAAAAVAAALAGRAALAWACREGIPAARREGLGAAVAGTVPAGPAAALAAGAALVAAALVAAARPAPGLGAVAGAGAVVLGLCAAEGLLRHCRRRLGGVTGDVLGALAETAATLTLLTLTLGVRT
ncbi:adenosylcobinamide-GDP ribazoletransferase [Streptomyces aidingensis]|uniref:Adenosylcobinamide-GDP ribazoletransferase n=1 Tax=Streptomyces aidingensis TaxID=910347 RepID=A0A1I1LF90_9ACTN|nr:adenosylcobinamide-GDP ribazoletransferase [Streptomyces aidingensis]SFC71636.1 adenosylcobinamide-GDP ribazoletransferase [Streptomyces aidingensis]